MSAPKIMLDLGCGFTKHPGYIRIDTREEVGPDIVRDIESMGLVGAWDEHGTGVHVEENSVDVIRAHDFLEHIHIGRTGYVLEEIWRVLKPGGLFDVMVPSTDGRGAFQDPTHVSFWNINSWLYYMDDHWRAIYGTQIKFSGRVWDVETNPDKKIVHTYGELYAVK